MPKIVDHQQRRQHIASIAVKLIANQGLEHTSIRQIARESGYSKGIVEHYFENKDELISCTLDWINQSYKDRIEKAVHGLIGLEALKVRISETLPLNLVSREEWVVRLRFWSLATTNQEQQDIQSQRFSLAGEAFLQDLKQAKKLAQIRPTTKVEVAANRILFTVSGASISSLHSPNIISEKQFRRLPREIVNELKI